MSFDLPNISFVYTNLSATGTAPPFRHGYGHGPCIHLKECTRGLSPIQTPVQRYGLACLSAACACARATILQCFCLFVIYVFKHKYYIIQHTVDGPPVVVSMNSSAIIRICYFHSLWPQTCDTCGPPRHSTPEFN